MDLLPKSQWLLKAFGSYVAAGIYEHPLGCVYWSKISTVELPNTLIEEADLNRFGISIFNGIALQDVSKASGER